ncbi:MAG: YceI family protein [Candidatus Acidiferrales bacterium]
MRRRRYNANVVRVAWIFALFLSAAAYAWPQASQPAVQTSPREVTLNLDPAMSHLHWTLGSTLHTVHGTFALKRGVVKFDPASGNASGEFVADAASGRSGNESRDKKMNGEILESARYTEVIFRPNRIEGKVLAHGSSNVQMQGTFLLHGSEHALTVPVQAELTGNHWKGSAKFSVPYIEWGLKSPNTFFLKADPAVEIELELSGTLQEAAAQ